MNYMVCRRKLMIYLLLILVLLTACNQTNLPKDILEPVSYTESEIKIYKSDKEKIITSYKVVQYDGLQYLQINDFIHLCNLMNHQLKVIKDLDVRNYNDAKHELSITYRADANFKGEIISELIGSGFKLDKRVISGTDSQQTISFNDGLFSYILIDQNIYLPIEAIRTLVFNSDLYLLKLNSLEYVLLGEESLNESMSIEIAAGMIEVDSSLFNKSLQQFTFIDSLPIKISNVADYTHYYYELLKLVDLRNDYHSFVYPVSDVSKESLSEMGFDIFKKTSNHQKFIDIFDVSAPETMSWEVLNPATIYIDVNSFSIEPLAFNSQLNKLKVELAENLTVDSVIIDLRNNTGGFSRNAFGFLSMFIHENLKLNFGYYVNQELISTQHYELVKSNASQNNYKLTVLVNQSSASASLLLASLLKDNREVVIIGSEPQFKKTLQLVYFQLLDGTIVTESSKQYRLTSRNDEIFDELRLVDEQMDDESISSWLEALRKE